MKNVYKILQCLCCRIESPSKGIMHCLLHRVIDSNFHVQSSYIYCIYNIVVFFMPAVISHDEESHDNVIAMIMSRHIK